MKYRITFSDGPMGNRDKHIDVDADSSDEAFKMAYAMPEAKNHMYTDVMVEKHPLGASPIGLTIEYYDTYFKEYYTGTMIIKAENEDQAMEYYDRNYKGKHFWFNCGQIEDDGKCVYGKIKDTYFAACPGYDADATKGDG